MRILLIAYDFPPTPSPQSLRWAYLVRELFDSGHDVHVLAPDVGAPGAEGLPEIPSGVVVHRVFPGPLAGLVASRRRKSPLPAGADALPVHPPCDPGAGRRLQARLEERLSRPFGGGLNWKGVLFESAKAIVSCVLFPDARSEWLPWARRKLDVLLSELKPDVVVTSHEPANTLGLGLRAKRAGFFWMADLGDPVLAPYTPRRWRRRARSLERQTCRRADLVTVTSAHAQRLLAARHRIDATRCRVLTQGFDHRFACDAGDEGLFDPARLELLYTGSFYSFRRIGALLQAIAAVPGVRLNIATVRPPAEIVEAARRQPSQVRLLGFVPHRTALALQRQCDVLLTIANEDPVQVPGKVYEYLGSTAPILGIGGGDDACGHLLRLSGAGWCVPNQLEPLAARLASLLSQKRATGRLRRAAPGDYDILQHSWSALSAQLVQTLVELQRPTHETPRLAPGAFHEWETRHE